jgi:sulfate adenylyltransferase subunit 1
MDLVDYKEEAFHKIKSDFDRISTKLDVHDIRFVPISAKLGDNVVDRSKNMDWYDGPTLMYLLENIHIASDIDHNNTRFPVQYVIRPMKDEYHDYRGYAGRIEGGVFYKGDKVKVLPSGLTSKIKSIDVFGGHAEEAFAPQSVTLSLEDDMDVSRGDLIIKDNGLPKSSQDIEMMICWFHEKPMVLGGKYIIRHTTNELKCVIRDVKYRIDVNTLDHDVENKKIGLNDIAKISIKTTKPLHYDSYRKNRKTGSIILIDPATNNTVAAGMII